MPRKARRKFTEEFKKETVCLLLSGNSRLSEISRDLDISQSVLASWRKQYGPQESSSPQSRDSQTSEIASLKKRLNTITIERDILKKAIGYFANPRG